MIDTRILRRQYWPCSVRYYGDKVHEVSMVTMLVLPLATMTDGEQGMRRLEWREDNRNLVVVHVGQIQKVAHLIGEHTRKGWL